MDERKFDALTLLLASTPSRRAALGALLGAGLAGALDHAATKTRKRQVKRQRGKARGGVTAEAADCANPGPSANMNGCNFNNRDFVEADLSSSSMRGTRFRGANLCGADLSSSQLRDADFRGFPVGQGSGNPTIMFRADLRSSGCNGTLFNARTRLCRTRTCSGAISDRDCPAGIDPQDVCCVDADCPVGRPCRDGQCCRPSCVGRACNDDGCGGTCPCPGPVEICVETGAIRCCCPAAPPFAVRCIANDEQQTCCCPNIPPFPAFCRISPSGATCCCTGEAQSCVDTGRGPECQLPG